MAQIVYGLLCDRRGCPVAVEVFEGSLHDDKTLPAQIAKLKDRFGLAAVIVVSDRGMVTKANLELLRASERRRLDHRAEGTAGQEARQGLEISSCRCLTSTTWPRSPPTTTPASGWSSAATRSSPPSGRASARTCCRRPSGRSPEIKAERVERASLQGEAAIALAVGEIWNRWRVRKHFQARDPRHRLPLRPQAGADRRRSGTRRHLRPAHQRRRNRRSPRPTSCAPTSSSRRSSAPSARSKAHSSCARSITASKTASEHTSFSACSPTTSPGTCARPGSRCSSTTSSRPPQTRPGRESEALTPGRAEGAQQTHHDRRALPLAHQSARRALHPHPQHDPTSTAARSFDQLTEPTPTQARALALIETYKLNDVVTNDPGAAARKAAPRSEEPAASSEELRSSRSDPSARR